MARLKRNVVGRPVGSILRLTGRIRDGAIETNLVVGYTFAERPKANWQDSRWRD